MTLKLDAFITDKLTKDRGGVPTQAELDAVWEDVKEYEGKKVRDVGVQGCLEIAAKLAKHFEGCVPHIYCDHLGKQTIGIGLLIDSSAKSVLDGLSMTLKSGGGTASAAAKQADWDACKAHFDKNSSSPPTHTAYASITKCQISVELAEQKCAEVMKSKADQLFNAAYPNTKQHEATYLDYPALAWGLLINLAFALGNKGVNGFPTMNGAFKSGDWEKAAKESWVSAHSRLTLGTRYQLLMLCKGAKASESATTSTPAPPVVNGEPSPFDLTSMTEDQLYEHLKQVWRRAQERFGTSGDAAYDFQEANGRINLIGARGMLPDKLTPVENRSLAWDDTMFVAYKDAQGARHVKTFYLSTEPNDTAAPDHNSTLMFGMHRYWLGFHHSTSTYKQLDDYLDHFAGKDYQYRALKPHTSGVKTFLDKSGDQKQDADEKVILDAAINIHYGGSKDTPKGWSHGCQVLKGPKGYRDFIALLETDTSIIGSINNDVSPKPTENGKRYVIYLLVEGTFLAPPSVCFPVAGKDADAHYSLNEAGEGGFFPIGTNNFWHGGIHLDAGADPIVAIADGEVVAYRINKKAIEVTLGGESMRYSSSFVLIHHERYTPKGAKIDLFSLAMHLLPFDEYTAEQKNKPPALFKKHTFTVATSEDNGGLNVREAGRGTKVVRVAKMGETVKFKNPNTVAPGGSLSAGWAELEGGGWIYVRTGDNPSVKHEFKLEPEEFDKVVSCKLPIPGGAIIGYPGVFFTQPTTIHFEVITADVEFMKNPKGDKGGKGQLKIAKGTKLKARKATTQPEIKVDLPPGSRLALLDQPPGDDRKVKCTDIVGWTKKSLLGTYDSSTKAYTLSADLASLTTQAGGGATVTINAKKGDKVYWVEQQGDTDRRVRFTLPPAEQTKRTGWAKRASLGDWSEGQKQYTLKEALASLYKDKPEGGGFVFDTDAGTCAAEIVTDELPSSDARVCKDKDGHTWQEVDFGSGKGWAQIDKDAKVITAYDWPHWERVEESGSFSEDGICDAPELLALVDADKDGTVTSNEIKAAVRDPVVGPKLRKLAVLHPTEWAGEIKGLDRLMSAPWFIDKPWLDATKDYIKKLGFWGDASKAGLPPKDKVWHVHPIGLIEHWRSLSLLLAPHAENQTAPDEDPTESSQTTSNEPKDTTPKTSELIIYCAHDTDKKVHRAKDVTRFEVVQDLDKGKDRVTVLHRDHGESKPDSISVMCRNEKTTVKATKHPELYAQYDLDVPFRGAEVHNILEGTFWKNFVSPTEYSVTGLSKALTIASYRPNKWKLSIEMPPMRGYKVGSKLEKDTTVTQTPKGPAVTTKKTVTLEKEVTGWKKVETQTTTQTHTTGANPSSTPPDTKLKSDSPDFPIKLSCDGKLYNEEVSTFNTILGIVAVASQVLEILSAIQDKVPKVGFYFEQSIQIFQGTFGLQWGMKEYTDHRSFLWFKANLEFVIFSIAVEVGVGVSGCGFKAQIYAKIEGSLSLSLGVERVNPGAGLALQVPLKLSVQGTIGARFEVGNWVKLDANFSTAVEIGGTFEIHMEKGVSLSGKMEWTGIAGKVSASVGTGGCMGSYVSEQTLVEGKDLGSFKWPDKPYAPPFLARSDIKSIMEDKMCDGLNIRVFTPSGSAFIPDTQWSDEKIAETLTAKIDSRKDIRRDWKSMEGLAHDIRQRLDIIGIRDWARDWIDDKTFLNFVNKDLDKIMTASYIDPCKQLVDRCK